MQVTLRIRRYDPESDERARYEEHTLDVEPTDRVLDVLNHIKWYIDGTLTYRASCAHGICGSDAMLINGVNRLACKVLVKDMGPRITVEPLRGFPVIKDLLVDMEGFFAAYRTVKPWLINDDPAPTFERRQSPKERELYDDTTKCILCASCTTSCPMFWANPGYIGPAAIVNAHRFIFDSRDKAGKERLEILNARDGVWRCRTIFNCTDACPRDIEVTRAIAEVKRAIMYGSV